MSRPLPPGCVPERSLSRSPEGEVQLVRRADELLVLRTCERPGALFASVTPALRLGVAGLLEPLEWGTTPEGGAWVLRRFVPGRPFDEALRDADESRVVAWTRSLLRTLEALHRAGFVHRDVKASNVIVEEDEVHLVDLDFVGLSSALPDEVAGSRHHLAPEVLLGQGHHPASDLFSLGVMLATCYCGEPSSSFHERFPTASFWEAAALDPERLPAPLAPLVLTAVRRHPGDRPASARAAIRLLPGGGASVAPPERGLPFAAGREKAIEEIVASVEAAPSLVLVVAVEAGEAPLLARELRLAMAIRGLFAFEGLRPDPPSGRLVKVDPLRADVDEHEALEELLACIHDPGSEGGAVVILHRPLVDRVVHRVKGVLDWDETPRFRTLRFPRVAPGTLEDHLLALTDGASPGTVRKLARSLWRVSEGRYFDVQRCLAGAVEAGVLGILEGTYSALQEEWPAGAPEAGLVEEVRGLGPRARSLLQAFAALADEATVDRAVRVAGLDPDAFRAAWRELHQRRLFAPGLEPGERVILADPRWPRAALAAADRKGLRLLHAACEEVLRQDGCPERRLALHVLARASRASELEAVVDVAERERAAGRLASARRLAEAVAARAGRFKTVRTRVTTLIARLEIGQGSAARALELLEELHGQELEGAAAATLLVAAEAAETDGQRRRARQCFERAHELARNPAERQDALIGMGYCTLLDGSPTGALRLVEEEAEAPASPAQAAGFGSLRGGALAQIGELQRAARILDQALDAARQSGDPTLVGRVELNRAFVDRRSGRYREAVAELKRAKAAFDSTDHVKLRALAANNLGVLQRDLGDLRGAQGVLQESLALRRRVGDAYGAGSSQASLGIAILDAGELDTALRLLEPAVEAFLRGGHPREATYVRLHLAIALALADRVEEARQHLESAAAGDAGSTAPALLARARSALLLVRGERAEALACLRPALTTEAVQGEESERFRVAAWCVALDPQDERAAHLLEAGAQAFGSPARRCELEWLRRDPGQTTREDLARWLEVFDGFGRTDLVRAVALAYAAGLGHEGDPVLRRTVTARAAGAADACVGSLPPTQRDRVLERLLLLSGATGVGAQPAVIGIDWFLQWNRRLVLERDIESLLRATIDMALDATGARRGFLVLMRDETVEVQTARGLDHEDMTPEQLRFSQTVVRQAIRDERSVLTTDAASDQRFRAAKSVRSWKIRSVLCTPLFTADGLTGALYVDNDQVDSAFDEYDVRIVRSLADQAAIAITNLRRNQEIQALNERLEERLALRDDELARSRRLLRDAGRVPPLGWLLGDSAAMQELTDQVDRLAATDLPIRLRCASGSGEEGVARAIHERSPRAAKPFVWRNARALVEEKLDEEFFGRARSQESRARRGLFAKAEGGTLFLAEVSALPLPFQEDLTAALETGFYRPVGGADLVRLDVRCIVSCRGGLEAMVEQGAFREDLYRLVSAAELHVPRLSERLEDIPLLVHAFVDELNARHEGRKRIASEVVAALVRRPWDGELRELRNEVARLYALAHGDIDDPGAVRRAPSSGHEPDPMPASFRLEDVERAAIARALEASHHRKDQAAKLLGISRAGLYTKMRRLGLSLD